MADTSLPPELKELVKGLPQDKADEVLSKLLEVAVLDYRPLKESDVRALKAKGAARFGMMDADMDLPWDELRQQNCIAIGAFSTEEQPVAFIVAELTRLRDAQELRDQDDADATPASTQPPQSPPSPSPPAPSKDHTRQQPAASSSTSHGLADAQELMQCAGCGSGDALVLGIRLLGVDFEYRRQGVGTQLLDFVKEVAQLAGACMAWLNVADFNPAALKFWEAAGFQRTSRMRRSEQGSFPLYMLPLEPAKQQKGAKGKKGSKSKAPAQKTGKGFGQVRASYAPSMPHRSSQLLHTQARAHPCTSRAYLSSSRSGLHAQTRLSCTLLPSGGHSGLRLVLR